MKIELKKLVLQYFKGAKNVTVDFSNRTEIGGANETGKTRLVDSWSWLLFGKNSEDQKDFSIKCLDKNNEPEHRVDTSVTGILSIDGVDTKFERIYKEKWVKKRGEETPEFAGHETDFFVNGVPHLLKDYNEKVESILPESLFKQLTNPAHFNSMKWTDRRAMLFEMAGNVKNSDVIIAHPDLRKFYESITGKTFEEFTKELAATKKLLKESIQSIPARIDEVSRAIVPDPDYVQIDIDIKKHNAKLTEIDGLINSDAEKFNSLNRKNQEKQNKMFDLTKKINNLVFENRNKAARERNEAVLIQNKFANEITNIKQDIESTEGHINGHEREMQSLKSDNDQLREKWNKVNGETLTFEEDEFTCPACKRPLETKDRETKEAEMTATFNASKIAGLQRITDEGQTNKQEIERHGVEINKDKTFLETKKAELAKKQKEHDTIVIPEVADITPDPQIKVLQDEITELQKTIIPQDKLDNTELINEKGLINTALDVLKKQLNIEEQNEKLKVRKQELIDQEKSLSQQIADLEKQEFQCEAFTRAKIEMIEDKVNSMFSLVKFKMFNNLINGGSEEVCETLINGVPFPDANKAARINAGIDIIRTLSKHYDVFAPIFIDNAEAVNEIIDTDSQMIKLFVTKDKKLKIVTN